jgi:hypothetical protein
MIAVLVALGTGAVAQTPEHMKFRGVINDFTPASTVAPGGPWEVRGPWSLVMKGRYGRADCKADFSAALTMERSDLGVIKSGGGDLDNATGRMQHTHHITLADGEVTVIPGGIQVTGSAVITANGIFPPPFGSDYPTLTIEITGGTGENSVAFSNVTLLFGKPAAGHFGTAPLHGVVVRSGDTRNSVGH